MSMLQTIRAARTMSTPVKRSISRASTSEAHISILGVVLMSAPVKRRRRSSSSSPDLVEVKQEWAEWPAPRDKMDEARRFILDM
jgi:hypothetical protein